MFTSSQILAFISPIFSALFIWYVQFQCSRRDRRMEEERKRERLKLEYIEKQKEKEKIEHIKTRKKENLLTMHMIKAIGKLSYANSIAIKEGKVNGVMDEAIIYYISTSREMTDFLQETAIEHWNNE